jgi:hypothetical protein
VASKLVVSPAAGLPSALDCLTTSTQQAGSPAVDGVDTSLEGEFPPELLERLAEEVLLGSAVGGTSDAVDDDADYEHDVDHQALQECMSEALAAHHTEVSAARALLTSAPHLKHRLDDIAASLSSPALTGDPFDPIVREEVLVDAVEADHGNACGALVDRSQGVDSLYDASLDPLFQKHATVFARFGAAMQLLVSNGIIFGRGDEGCGGQAADHHQHAVLGISGRPELLTVVLFTAPVAVRHYWGGAACDEGQDHLITYALAMHLVISY